MVIFHGAEPAMPCVKSRALADNSWLVGFYQNIIFSHSSQLLRASDRETAVWMSCESIWSWFNAFHFVPSVALGGSLSFWETVLYSLSSWSCKFCITSGISPLTAPPTVPVCRLDAFHFFISCCISWHHRCSAWLDFTHTCWLLLRSSDTVRFGLIL